MMEGMYVLKLNGQYIKLIKLWKNYIL
jgi:hypothetical protein